MLIVANWKAYVEEAARAKALFAAAKRAAARGKVEIVLAPPAPYLGMLSPKNRSKVAFAAQDVSALGGGAATGEVTAQAYADLGATYAIIGHSERRAMGETDAAVGEKLTHAIAHGLTPILCVGEHERDAESAYLATIRDEITAALTPVPERERGEVIFAYEPLWAIGKSAADAIDPSDLAEMVLYIRKIASGLSTGKKHARVLYGGSVEPENVRALAGGSGVDGFLVGHASVDPKIFTALAKALA